MATAKQLLRPSPISNTQFTVPHSYIQLNPKTYPIFLSNHPPKTLFTSQGRHLSPILKAAPQNTTTGEDDGISLGTMKLPPNTDLARFETLLFQVTESHFLSHLHSDSDNSFTVGEQSLPGSFSPSLRPPQGLNFDPKFSVDSLPLSVLGVSRWIE